MVLLLEEFLPNSSFRKGRFLSGLDADAIDLEYKIAAEYQDRQHFTQVEHWAKTGKDFVLAVEHDNFKAWEAAKDGYYLMQIVHGSFAQIAEAILDCLGILCFRPRVTQTWDSLEKNYYVERDVILKRTPAGGWKRAGRPQSPVWSWLLSEPKPFSTMKTPCYYCKEDCHLGGCSARAKYHLMRKCPGFQSWLAAILADQ